MERFSPAVRSWFESNFEASTRVQRLGWPVLADGDHALLIAPTGSGKTLAAFLWALDRLGSLPEDAERGVRVLYVSPLKALVYDIERNLRAPLVGIQRAAERIGEARRPVRVDVRTGDTAQRDRRRQIKDPGEVLVTTPESLFLILGSQAAETLRTVDTVIVDEIHVFAPTKRGAHLALSLERLAEIAEQEPQRIGLSATVRPADAVARFLGGPRPVQVVDASEPAHVSLTVTVPVPDMDDLPRLGAPGRGADSGGSDSGGSDSGGSVLGQLVREAEGGGWPRGAETSGIWPQIYPRLLDQILEHRSTLVFVNSRGLCERLAQRLNDLWAERVAADSEGEPLEPGDGTVAEPAPELVRAHHGSVSHEKRADVEEALKAGRLRAIVATSSLELGIDMGAIDLVVLIESPGSVARGLQRVGRAGHSVGEVSEGVIFPKFKGDLLECAVVARRMGEGTLEPVEIPKNPLDVLAQQIVALCCTQPRTVAEVEQLVRRAEPFRELPGEVLHAVLDMLSGRYPSHELADLRPTLVWDRGQDLLSARRGAAMLTRLNAGTIPDRGLYSVHLGEEGPRLGELDEEMVYESRVGDTFLLGASTWRVIEITRDRVLVQPAPGEPGRMPFWHGDGPGRPIHLGRALGEFLRELTALDGDAAVERLRETTPLDENAIVNLVDYLAEQREATGVVPSDRTIVVERFRDELGDWRVCVLTPFGSRVHGPWAMALERLLGERAGFEVEAMATDDGIVLRFADTEELPDPSTLFPDADEVEDLIVDQVGSSALFASRFRENAARAMLLPRNRPGKRSPLWQQRLRAKNLLAAVHRFSDFPIVLETYRECLRDVFDVPALASLLRAVERREVRVEEVETREASPFARSLVYAYVANYLYEQDSPVAERKAQALTLDRNLLRELLGHSELRELLDAAVIEQIEEDLQRLSEETRARDADELADVLRRLGDLDDAEAFARSEAEEAKEVEGWLDRLLTERRACSVQIAGARRWIATDDVALYRDALGIQPPSGLPDTLLAARATPLEDLIARFAATHGPFLTERVASRFGLTAGQVEPVLKSLLVEGRLVRGEIRPGGSTPEWCDAGVLRRIKRATLAKLRGEVAPVGAEALARFLPRWQGIERLDEAAVPSAGVSGGVSGAAGRRGPRRMPDRAFGGKRVASSEAQLDEALVQLEGYPLPFSALSQTVLPARVDGFRVEQLDLRAAAGDLVWVGRAPIGTRDGKVALYRRDRAAVLLARPDDELEIEGDTAIHQALLEHLRQRGACFTFELERLPELEGREGREIQAAIWDLVWAGRVTNDTFQPLVSLGARRRTGGSARPSVGRSARLSRRAASVRERTRGSIVGGRWSLVADLVDPSVSETERAFAVASQLAERYGLVSREAALAEEIPGGFQSLLPVLREMEESGRMRRGYFVEGLAGRQYALPGAVELLRREREDEEHARGAAKHDELRVLAAVDPASPWGSLLPWPPGRREDGPRPRRVPGAWVVLRRGVPLCFVDAGGRSLVTFGGFDERAAEVAADGLMRVAQEARRRSVRLTRIDGEPAAASGVAPHLVGAGFAEESTGLRLSR